MNYRSFAISDFSVVRLCAGIDARNVDDATFPGPSRFSRVGSSHRTSLAWFQISVVLICQLPKNRWVDVRVDAKMRS
jgi:hypothetical protein